MPSNTSSHINVVSPFERTGGHFTSARWKRWACVAACLGWGVLASAQQPAAPAPAGNDEVYQTAIAEFDAGDFEGSLAKIDQLLKDFTDPPPEILKALEAAYYVRAAALYNLKRYDAAVEAVRVYIQKFPGGKRLDDAAFFLANSLVALKRYDEALPELAKLEAVPGLREDVLFLQAGIYYEKKDFKSALRPLLALTASGMNSSAAVRAGVMLGAMYTQLGQYDKATDTVMKVRRAFFLVDNKAQYNATVLELGDKLFNAGLPREAQQIYQLVMSKKDLIAAQQQAIARKEMLIGKAIEMFRATKDMAFLRRRSRMEGEVVEEKASLAQLEKLPDFMPGILIRRGRAYAEVGRHRESLVVFDHIVENYPDAKEERDIAAFSRILAFADIGKVDPAIAAATFYLDKFPAGTQRETATYLRGALSLDANDPAKAASYFGTAIAQADEKLRKSHLFPRMIFLVGVAKFVLGEYEEATRRFEEYLSKFPGAEMAEEAQYRIALATLFGGKEIGYKKAIGLFQNYLGKFPNGSFVTDAEYRIAVCRMTAGEHEAVVKACDDWMRKHRGENIAGEVLALKGDALDAMGRKPEAALAYEESSDVATSEEVLSYSLFEAAKRYQDLGDWQRMEEMFRKFLRNRPDHPSEVAAYFYIGQAMNKQGKIQEAKEFVAGKIREFIEDPRKEAVERLLSQLAQMCVRKPRQPPGAEIPPAPMPEVAATGTDGVPVPTPVPVPRVKVDPTIEFEEILATFPDTPTAAARKLFARSELEMMRRKPLESAGYFAQIVETAKPEALSPILLGRVGDALLAKGEVEKAREMYDQIIGAFPKSEFADFGYVGRGELAMREKNWKEALKNFTIAADEIAASSKLRDATLGKARAMFELQQYDEAEKLFELVSSAKEWRGEATAVSLHYLGRIAQQRKDYAKAIAFFQRVYLTHQKYPAIVALAYLDSADCFKDLGKVQEARNTYAEMLRNEKLKAAKVPQLEEARKRMEQLGPA